MNKSEFLCYVTLNALNADHILIVNIRLDLALFSPQKKEVLGVREVAKSQTRPCRLEAPAAKRPPALHQPQLLLLLQGIFLLTIAEI